MSNEEEEQPTISNSESVEEQQAEPSTDPIKELAELSRLHFEKEKLIESLQAENEKLTIQILQLDSLACAYRTEKQEQAEEIERLKGLLDE
jgi:hypothetical protein